MSSRYIHCFDCSCVLESPNRLDIEGNEGLWISSIGGDGGGCGADIYEYWWGCAEYGYATIDEAMAAAD